MCEFLRRILPGTKFGLYITDGFIQVVQFKGNIKKAEVKAIGHLVLEPGLVVNGEIIQPKIVAERIKTLLAGTKPFPIKDLKCYMSLPESQCYSVFFTLPANISRSEFKAKIEEEVKERIPVAYDEIKYNFSVHTIGKISIIYLVAAKKAVIAQYLEVTEGLNKLIPLVLEPESLSLLRDVNIQTKQPDEGVVLVDFAGEKISWFALLNGKIVDSNQTTKANFIEDLAASAVLFKEQTAHEIKNILISGENDSILAKNLKQKLGIQPQLIDKYISTYYFGKKDYQLQFKISAGLAVRALGVDMRTKINLLKQPWFW
jgi:Tfp pilus assembly PilM family ATPase